MYHRILTAVKSLSKRIPLASQITGGRAIAPCPPCSYGNEHDQEALQMSEVWIGVGCIMAQLYNKQPNWRQISKSSCIIFPGKTLTFWQCCYTWEMYLVSQKHLKLKLHNFSLLRSAQTMLALTFEFSTTIAWRHEAWRNNFL